MPLFTRITSGDPATPESINTPLAALEAAIETLQATVADHASRIAALEVGAGSALAAPVLNTISNADGDGAYTVDWEAVSGATSYLLQVDTAADFSSATTAYEGANTDLAVTGQADGTYYYRVRCSDATRTSAWSNSRSVLVATTTSYPLADDMTAYWPLDVTSGTRYDATPNGYDLTDINTVGYMTGVQGNAASFTPADADALRAGSALGLTSSFSLFGWLRPTGGYLSGRILGAGEDYFAAGPNVYIGGSGFIVAFSTGNGTGTHLVSISKTGPANDTWCFFVANVAISGRDVTLDLAIDNSWATQVTGTMGADIGADNTAPYVGASRTGTATLLGALDEVGILGRVMTTTEATWLYNSGAGRDWAEIAAYTGS